MSIIIWRHNVTWLAVLFLFLLTMGVTAAFACCGNDMGVSPWPQMPPPRYDHPYRGHLTVRTGTAAQIHQWCGSFFVLACAMPNGSGCTVYLPAWQPGSSPAVLAALRRHEIAHCNGWAGNHPG